MTHRNPASLAPVPLAAPLAPVPQVDALSVRALLALWHKRNLEAAEAQAQVVEDSIHLFSDWRNPLESCRDYVNYVESWTNPYDDWGHYIGSQAIRT